MEAGKSASLVDDPASLLPSYLREDPRGTAAALARQLTDLMGLDQEHARQLVMLARALSKIEGQVGSGSDPVSKLDFPARTFLVSCRIAADLDCKFRTRPQDSKGGIKDDASYLFRQV